MALKRKTDREVKMTVIDKQPLEEFTKKAKVIVSTGFNSILSRIDPLTSFTPPRSDGNQQTPRANVNWVGAYPHLSSIQGAFSYLNNNDHTPERSVSASSFGRPRYHRSTPSLSSLSSESSRPYKLQPYTKQPAYSPLTSQDSRSPSSDLYSRSGHSDDSGSDSSLSHYHRDHHRTTHPWTLSRFNNHPSNKYSQDTLLRMRIHAGKAQKAASLLQSKYNKDDSLARQRIMDRYSQVAPKSAQSRLKAVLDATIGALKSDRTKTPTERSTETADTVENKGDADNQRRVRAYKWPYDDDEESTEKTPNYRRSTWIRAKMPTTEKEPSWLQNLRNLIAKTLPSVVEVKKDLPGYQDIVSEHDRIELELAEDLQGNRIAPLNKDEENKVEAALSDGHGQVAEGFNVSIMKKDIHTLRPYEWLNDEVINFYGQLIMARNKGSTTLPKVHVFSTFFYKTLSETGYDKVRRWTKKVNVFAMDYLLVPIHCSGNHWTSAVIDMKKKQLEYYDSLLGNNPRCFI
ncbi:SUMO1 sentrin specific peptidase 1, partial [Podila humilis]